MLRAATRSGLPDGPGLSVAVTLEFASGGRETSSPEGVGTCVAPPGPAPGANVPDMPIWPQAART